MTEEEIIRSGTEEWTTDDWTRASRKWNESNQQLARIASKLSFKDRQEINRKMQNSADSDDPYLPFLYKLFNLPDNVLHAVTQAISPPQKLSRRIFHVIHKPKKEK